MPVTTVSRIASGLVLISLGVAACTSPATRPGPGAQDDPLYDSDRNVVLVDRDGDGVPDLAEEIAGSDPANAADTPRSRTEEVFQEYLSQRVPRSPSQGVCLSNYVQFGPLCIWNNAQDFDWRYDDASNLCRILGGYFQVGNPRVATYEDLFHIYYWHPSATSSYNPKNRWIGNIVADNKVLCGNRHVSYSGDPDRYDFDGTCNKSDERSFWCAYDAY